MTRHVPAPPPRAGRRAAPEPAGVASGDRSMCSSGAGLMHPRLGGCRRVFLRDHAVQLSIGVHEFEKRGPQRVLINVDLYVPLARSTPRRDSIEEVLDYDFIRRSIAERVAGGHVHLQETLADELLATLLAHPQVRAARVSTEKPDVYPDCTSVGVEVFGFADEPQGALPA